MHIRTPRLRLRDLTADDLPSLERILQDPTTMWAYEGAFSGAETAAWLGRQLQSYVRNGHGLWAVELVETGHVIGQCGITRQQLDEASVLEVGYLFDRAFWGHGYASEAAAACRDVAFRQFGAARVYSIIRDTNLASMNVAIRCGMTVRRRFVKHYRGIDMPHLAFAIDRNAWEGEQR